MGEFAKNVSEEVKSNVYEDHEYRQLQHIKLPIKFESLNIGDQLRVKASFSIENIRGKNTVLTQDSILYVWMVLNDRYGVSQDRQYFYIYKDDDNIAKVEKIKPKKKQQ